MKRVSCIYGAGAVKLNECTTEPTRPPRTVQPAVPRLSESRVTLVRRVQTQANRRSALVPKALVGVTCFGFNRGTGH